MRILALETSTEYCSCALSVDGDVQEVFEHAGQRHSSLLLPMVARLMADCGVTFGALDAIAFGAGPGSFTGLRIACATAQGLAFARDTPVLPVSTLEALAEDGGAIRALCCLDARMGELYLAAYAREGPDWRCVHAPCLVKPGALPELPGPWAGIGSGFAIHAEALVARYAPAVVAPQAVPRARAVAALGTRGFGRGEALPAAQALPVYLRDKVALDVTEQAAARAARQAAA